MITAHVKAKLTVGMFMHLYFKIPQRKSHGFFVRQAWQFSSQIKISWEYHGLAFDKILFKCWLKA